MRDLYAGIITGDFYSFPVRKQLELQAERLAEGHRAGDDAVCFQIGSWHPALTGKPDAQILAHAFTDDDARATLAREYGFKSWTDVPAGRRSNVNFEKAVNTMLAGDLPALRRSSARTPVSSANARSTATAPPCCTTPARTAWSLTGR